MRFVDPKIFATSSQEIRGYIPVMAALKFDVHRSVHRNIQGVTGGTDQTSGECSLGQTIPI